MYSVTHILLIIGKAVMKLPFIKMWIIAHYLFVKDVIRLSFWWNFTHSLSAIVKDCQTAFHEAHNIAHLLLVVGKDAIRMPFTEHSVSLTSCWSWEMIQYHETTFHRNVQCYSLPVCYGKMSKDCSYKSRNATHLLLVTMEGVMNLYFINTSHTYYWWWESVIKHVKCHSLSVGYRKSCQQTACQKHV